MTNQAGKTALITGASSGIGYEFTKLFAQRGHNLILVARNEAQLNQIANDLGARHKIQVTVLAKDLTNPNTPQELFDAIKAAGLTVDILINNAGFASYGSFTEIKTSTDLEMVQVNITALTHLTKLFLPGMVERRYGRVLNVASTAAFQPGPLMPVYYATKAYVLSLSEALAEEVRGTGVSVTALCPGPTESGFQKRASMEDSKLVKDKKIMDAATVAQQGYDALMQGKALIIPGLQNKLLAFSVRFLPRSLVARLVKRTQDRAH